jgi:hypothetical protein
VDHRGGVRLAQAGGTVDVAAVPRRALPSPTRLIALALCGFCLLAFLPALVLAYPGVIWFPDLSGRPALSAAALVAGPVPLGVGALLGRKAMKTGSRACLAGAAAATLVALGFYAVACAWGGRMLA